MIANNFKIAKISKSHAECFNNNHKKEKNQSKAAEVITELKLILAARLRQSRKVIFIIGREPGTFSATGPLCLLLE